jgi:hypothetical protein
MRSANTDGGMSRAASCAASRERHGCQRRLQRPDQQQQRNGDCHHNDFQRQAQLPVVAEAEAARPENQRVDLIADGSEERSRRADGHGHQKGVGIDTERRDCS